MNARWLTLILFLGMGVAFAGGYWLGLSEEAPALGVGPALSGKTSAAPSARPIAAVDSGAASREVETAAPLPVAPIEPSEKAASHHSRGKKAVPVILNPNTADAELLQTLPGIGPALAARILEDRAKNGPYKSAAELRRVRGIGPKILLRIRPYLQLPD